MAKDPAILWYWSDWNSGTTTLTRFLKGCYMDLLHAQFNNGRLSISEIKTVLGTDFGQAWPTLQKKFKQDDNTLFYNERLEAEQLKRQSYVKSRQNNLKKSHMKKHMGVHMGDDMGNHMDNVIENRNGLKEEKGGTGEKEGWYWDQEKQKFLNDGKWIYKFCQDKRLTQPVFESIANEFLSDLELKEDYKPIKEIRSHFTNWFNKNNKTNVSSGSIRAHPPGSNHKPGTSEARIQAARDY